MKTVEKTGKTLDEAIEAAVAELGCSRSDEGVDIKILQTPSKGFLGIGSKDAKVIVSVEDGFAAPAVKKEKAPVVIDDAPTAHAVAFLNQLFEQFNLDVDITPIQGEEFTTLNLEGKDLGILIGRRGETLDAFQYLTNLTVSRHFEERSKFILDVEGYRAKREETLKHLALKLAERVKDSGKNMSLEPMSPYERRIIHTVLQNDESVRTFSEGEEPYRKVVIARKK